MKEMIGGCCICADENGWTGNPLVYCDGERCDGEKCDVAVHQGCYGIVNVPDGPWLCARCSNSDTANQAQCSLCPTVNGALKRTDKLDWAHVICALYIPEVTFGDVNSMDPVITSQIPEWRYSQICYLCEQRGNNTAAHAGAVMQCNKPACKKYFHVTCAQAEGLLCEEGGMSQNVRYCGYCAQHAKKAATDPTIKVVPPYRPFRGSTSSGHSTPDVFSSRLSDKSMATTNGRPNSTCSAANNSNHLGPNVRQPDTNSMPASVGNAQSHQNPVKPDDSNKDTNTQNGPVSLAQPQASTSSAVPASFNVPPSMSTSLPNGPIHSTITDVVARFTPTASSAAHDNTVRTVNTATSSMADLPMAPSSIAVHKPGKRGRPPGSTSRIHSSADGDDRPKRRKTTKRTVKTLLELVDPVVQDTVSDFQRERVAAQQATTIGTPYLPSGTPMSMQASSAFEQSPLGSNSALNNMSQPQMLAGLGVMSHAVGTDLLSTAMSALPSAPIGIPLKPTPKLGLASPDAASIMSNQPSSSNAVYPTSLEQLLERQWEQGSQFLMEQAQHFDIASLLSCLNQLKVENQRLEESIMSLATRRDHLLAVNARLSLALGSSQTATSQSPLASPRTTQHHDNLDTSPSAALLHLRNMATTTNNVISLGAQSASKAAQTPGMSASSSTVLSPGTSAQPLVNGGSQYGHVGSSAGVFTSVANSRHQQAASVSGVHKQDMSNPFLTPPTPNSLMAAVTTAAAALPSNAYYPQPTSQLFQDQLYQQILMQHPALAGFSGYNNLAAAAAAVSNASQNSAQVNNT